MLQKLLAELLGTFMLVYVTVGSAALGEGLLSPALAQGLILWVLVASFAGVSGAHFNPAVTLGFASVGRHPWREVPTYIAMQLLGATLAALAVRQLYASGSEVVANGAGLPGAEQTTVVALAIGETLITFMLMVVIYGTLIDPRGKAASIGGLGVGAIVTANILVMGPATGASMNPARSLGPAAVLGSTFDSWSLHWCYWVGPIVGSVAAAWLYENVLLSPPVTAEVEELRKE